MKKVIVIGAGASGIIAALKVSENNEVILIESNDKIGKKLLLTGNGKCNYWNENIIKENYHTDNVLALEKILENKNEVLDYLYHLGIYPKVKNGYYYPYSGMAYSVCELFEYMLKDNDIKVFYNTKVSKIEKVNNEFKVYVPGDVITSDKVIIATGSKACPKTGSDGSGYDFAKSFGHNINPVLPALTSLRANEWFLKEWNGVRSDARLSLYIDDNFVMSEEGELQMTQDGISGICTFNISSEVSRALYDFKNVLVKINFVPFLNESFYSFFDKRSKELNQNVEVLLESILNYKVISVIMKRAGISKGAYWKSLTEDEKNNLCKMIENFELKIDEVNPVEKSQVCTGGVSLKEVNENMESSKCEGLYLTGELLDVDGKCGGFNLAFAFISGYLAGKDI